MDKRDDTQKDTRPMTLNNIEISLIKYIYIHTYIYIYNILE